MAAEARVRTAGFQRQRDATGETVTAAFVQFLERYGIARARLDSASNASVNAGPSWRTKLT